MQRISESRRRKRLKLNANNFFCNKPLWKRSLKRQNLNASAGLNERRLRRNRLRRNDCKG